MCGIPNSHFRSPAKQQSNRGAKKASPACGDGGGSVSGGHDDDDDDDDQSALLKLRIIISKEFRPRLSMSQDTIPCISLRIVS